MQTNVPKKGFDDMAQIAPVLRAELDPSRPVPEICSTINAITAFHPGQEAAVLKGVKEAIEKRLDQLEKEMN